MDSGVNSARRSLPTDIAATNRTPGLVSESASRTNGVRRIGADCSASIAFARRSGCSAKAACSRISIERSRTRFRCTPGVDLVGLGERVGAAAIDWIGSGF